MRFPVVNKAWSHHKPSISIAYPTVPPPFVNQTISFFPLLLLTAKLVWEPVEDTMDMWLFRFSSFSTEKTPFFLTLLSSDELDSYLSNTVSWIFSYYVSSLAAWFVWIRLDKLNVLLQWWLQLKIDNVGKWFLKTFVRTFINLIYTEVLVLPTLFLRNFTSWVMRNSICYNLLYNWSPLSQPYQHICFNESPRVKLPWQVEHYNCLLQLQLYFCILSWL